MNITDMRDLTADELQKKIDETRKELFDMRFKKALHQLENPAQLRAMKHRVAQLKTVLREKSQVSAPAKAEKPAEATATAGGENSENA